MNTILPHDSVNLADYDALCPALEHAPGTPGTAEPAIDRQPYGPMIDGMVAADGAALDVAEDETCEAAAKPGELADLDAAALPKVFDWASNLFNQVSRSLSRYVFSIRSLIARTPVFRGDSLDRVVRSQEDARKDVQKADQKKRTTSDEPLDVTVSTMRYQRLAGDQIIVELITTERHASTTITGDGKVVAQTVQSSSEVKELSR